MTKLQGKIGGTKEYKCEGGQGCKTPGCEFVAIGKPESVIEGVYMCPFNHWRSCRWVLVKADPAKATGDKTTTYDGLCAIAVESAKEAWCAGFDAENIDQQDYCDVFAQIKECFENRRELFVGKADPAKATGEKEVFEHFVCPECGKHAKADEDGCCATCGEDCTHEPCDCIPKPPVAPAGKDEGHTSCIGCVNADEKIKGDCLICVDWSKNSYGQIRARYTPQPPKGEDAPASKTYGYCTECDKVWQECLKLGLKIKTNGIEVTADDVIEGIRDLHRMAGEERYSVEEINAYLESLKSQVRNGSYNVAIEYARTTLNDERFGIKAVTEKGKGGR